MCLYAKIGIKIAKKNIKVIKLLFDGDLSIVFNYKYEVGVMPQPVNLVIKNRCVEVGYHAYTSIKAAIADGFEFDHTAEFIIPAGSSYVLGKDGDIVASQMYMTGSGYITRSDILRKLKIKNT